MTHQASILSGMVWSAVRVWGTRVTTLVVFMVLARLLKPVDMGVLALVAFYAQLGQLVADLGFGEYLIQKHERSAEQEATMYWLQISIAGTFAALLVVFDAPVARLLNLEHPDAARLVWVLAALLFIMSSNRLPEANLRRALKFKTLAIRSLVTTTIGGVIGISMAYKGFGVWSLMIKLLVETTLDALIVAVSTRWNPFHRLQPSLLIEPLRYGTRMLGSRLLELFSDRADTVIVQSFLGATALGYYSIGQRLFQVAYELLGGMCWQISVPYLSRVKESKDQFKAMVLKMSGALSLVTIPLFLLLSITASDLVPTLFGWKWQSAGPLLAVFALAGVPFGANHFNQIAPMAAGASNVYFRITVIMTVFAVIANTIAAQFGAMYVAGAQAFRVYVYLIVAGYAAYAYTGATARDHFRANRPALLIALITSLAAVVLWAVTRGISSPILRLSIIYIGFFVAYAFSFRAFAFEALGTLRAFVRGKA